MDQYPHYLYVRATDIDSTQDSNGDWVDQTEVNASGETATFHSMCREETNGAGSEVQTAGGIFHKFSSLIQLPKGTPKIQDGSPVIISNDEAMTDIRIRGSVLKFSADQLHCRLWV